MMHYTKEAYQNVSLCLFLCINIVINNFGSYLSCISLSLSFLLTFICSVGCETVIRGRKWIFLNEWLVLIRHVCFFSATCQCITEMLVVLSRPHPLDSLLPTLLLPKQIISIFIVLLIILLIYFGLENSEVLDGLVLGGTTGAVILYTIASISIHSTGHFATLMISLYDIDQVVLVCGLLKPFFINLIHPRGTNTRIWMNAFIFFIYFFVTIFMPSFDKIMCVEEGNIALLCPINVNHKWYEAGMSCLALVSLASLSPSMASRPVLSLATPSRLGVSFLSSEATSFRNNLKAILFLAVLTGLLTYWAHVYQLLHVNAIAYWLQELLTSISHLYYYYKPLHSYTESTRKTSLKNRCYEPVVENKAELKPESSFEDVELSETDSSDTDIDSFVEEYNDKIKVMTGSGVVKKSPTVLSSKTSYCCLTFISALCVCIPLALTLQFYILALYLALGAVILMVLLICMPRRGSAEFKTILRLILNYSVANIMIVPLINTYSSIISSIFIGLGIIIYTLPHIKTKISIVKHKSTIKLKCITDTLYSTKTFKVQKKNILA